tara:strand:+ start:945 stop:1304 length:360 start_codon:yes stop_codon:yes gene_type:complete
VLDCALDDVHSKVSAINPSTKPGVAVLKLVFPKACAAAQAGLINLNNLHAELYPIPPTEGVYYTAEVIKTEGTQVELLIDSLRPEIKFNLKLDKDVVGDHIEVVLREGNWDRRHKGFAK